MANLLSNTTVGGNSVIHVGNIGSHALTSLPSNAITTTGGQTIAGITYFSNGESINLYGIRGRFTNEYIHLYNKVGIGHPSGWGQGEGNTPNFGLSTYGGMNIAYGSDNGAIINTYTRINKDWGGGDYGAEAFTIRGTYPSITLRSTNANYKWLLHTDSSGNFRWYTGGSVDDNSWTNRFTFTTSNHFYVESGSVYAQSFIDVDNTGYYLNPASTSNLNAVGAESVTTRYYTQSANGVPSNNLGSPTVTEMALFNEQFNNKTAFLDPTRITIWQQVNNGDAWQDITSNYSQTEIRKFIAGYDTTGNIFVPNAVYSFRIEVTHPSYVFANAVYFYWSSQSHSTKLHLWARRTDNQNWYQISSSSTNVSSWPGHLYMPFNSIPWHPSANSSSHYDILRFEFIPNWSGHATYGTQPIYLNKMQVWGGYPAGTRFPYTVNEYGDFTARRHITGDIVYATGGNSSNWNTAYGWGNHASAGYQAASTAINTGNIGSQSVSYATSAGNSATTSQTTFSSLTVNNNSTFSGQSSWFGGYGGGSGPGIALENLSTFARFAFWGLDFYDWNHGIQMTIDNNYVSATNSFRAPIFYDSADTTYYGDFASTSYLRHLSVGDVNASNDGSWNARLNLTGSYHARLDVKSNSDGIITTMYSHTGNGVGKVGTMSNHPLAFMVNGGIAGYAYANYLQGVDSVRAPIFYDSQDTGYYVDPNSESKLRKLWINNGGAGAVSWSTGLNMGDGSNYWNLIQDAGVARQRNFGTGGYDWYNNTASTQIMLLSNAGNLSVSGNITTAGNAVIHSGNIGSQSVSYATTAGALSSMNISQFTNNSGYITGYTETDTLNSVTSRGNTTGNNIITSANVYASIFYDYNDNGYYVNPTSSSRVSRLWVDKLGGIGTYSWVDAALTTSSIEIVNQVGENGSLPPTLAFHWYGDGGPQFRLAADTSNILYLESAAAGSANTATNSTTYFNSLRLICQDSIGLYVNGNGVWHRGDFSSTNISNWNTAYSWGNHASAGYLTSSSLSGYATQTYVNNAVSALVDSAPGTLDTLNELAAALGDDPNFATTVATSIGTKWTQDNTKISNWDTAYSWGNHASAGYQSASTAITTSNIGSQSVSYAATAGSSPYLSALGDYVFSASTNGRDFSRGIQTSFVSASQGYPEYGSVVRIATYSGLNDGSTAELYFPYSPTYGGSSMRYRLGVYNNAGWTGWKTVIDSDNISSQSVSYASTAGSAPNGSNINNNYDVAVGNGNGLRFWGGSDSYKISMGVGSLYQYGPVTDYSIKTQMNDSSTDRGFTWGRISYAPIAALNSTSGDMEIAGYMKSYGYRGNGNVGGTGAASWHPDGIYVGSTQWLYGTMYKNGSSIYDVGELKMNGGPYLQTYNDRNLIVKGSSSSDVGIEGKNAAGSNVFQIYGNGSDYGFLNGTWAAWDIRKTKNGALYMNDTSGYYLHTNSTSNFYALNIQGNAVVHAANIGSQSVSYAATAGSAGSVSGLTLTSSSNGINPDSVTQNQIGYNTSVSLFGQTDGGLYSSAYSSAWIHQIYGDFRTGQIAIRGKNSGTWQSWRTVLDSGNYTSYSPSLTGSGASGTWGINVTGSAGSVAWTNVSSRPTALSQFTNDLGNYGGWLTTSGKAADSNLLDGLDLHTGRNNEANKVVRTDANGYIQAGWINTTSGDNGTTAISRIYASQDGYIRYYTPANFRAQITDGVYQPVGSYAAASHTHTPSQVGLGNVSNAAQVTTTYNSSLNSDSRNSRGVTRLYRRDSDSDYSVQTYWTGSYWRLYGYNGDSNHADTHVGYADSAGSANSVAWTNVSSRPTNLSQFTNDLGNYGGFLTSITAHTHAISDITGLQSALDGKQAAGSYAAASHDHDRIFLTDSRGASRAPSYYDDRYAQWDFQNTSDTGAGGDSWHGLLTVSKWTVWDASHRQEQIAFTGDDLKRRTASSDSAWGSWKTILDSSNYSSYAQPAASAINTSNIGSQSVSYATSAGSASSATNADTVDSLHASSFIRSDASDDFSGNLTSGSGNWIKFTHSSQSDSNDGKIGSGVFGTGLNIVGTQTSSGTGRIIRLWGTVMTDTGNQFIHQGNIGSQSVANATNATNATSANLVNRYSVVTGNTDWNTVGVANKLAIYSAGGFTSGQNNAPPNYTYGSLLSWRVTGEDMFQIYFPENSANSDGRKMYYRSGWNGTFSSWNRVLDMTGNIATVQGSNQTGLQIYANVGYNQDPLTFLHMRGQADNNWESLYIQLTGDAGGQNIEFRRFAQDGRNDRMWYISRIGSVVTFEYTVVTPSDSRLKDNQINISTPIDKVKKLNGVEFDWNAGNYKGQHDVGVIAQEVEEVLPEAVSTDEDGYKAVAYDKLVPLLIEAMKEQQGLIESLQARISALEGN